MKVKPTAATPTGTRLNHILRAYLKNYEEMDHKQLEVKPMNIIVITDGMPTDDVESVIIQAAERLDKVMATAYQLGIQFFQVSHLFLCEPVRHFMEKPVLILGAH
jgi:uncharacterized protein YegL